MRVRRRLALRPSRFSPIPISSSSSSCNSINSNSNSLLQSAVVSPLWVACGRLGRRPRLQIRAVYPSAPPSRLYLRQGPIRRARRLPRSQWFAINVLSAWRVLQARKPWSIIWIRNAECEALSRLVWLLCSCPWRVGLQPRREVVFSHRPMMPLCPLFRPCHLRCRQRRRRRKSLRKSRPNWQLASLTAPKSSRAG